MILIEVPVYETEYENSSLSVSRLYFMGTYYTVRDRQFGTPVIMLLLIIEFCKREVGCVGKYIHLTISRLVLLRNT